MSYVRNKPSISSEAAAAMITATRIKTDELGVAMSIAVVDESGDPKAFDRVEWPASYWLDLRADDPAENDRSA